MGKLQGFTKEVTLSNGYYINLADSISIKKFTFIKKALSTTAVENREI